MKRNISLLITTIIFALSILIIDSYFFGNKGGVINAKREEQKSVNEEYIFASIMDGGLENVKKLFEVNLATTKKDPRNKKADLDFINHLTDIFHKLEINVIQIKPLSPEKEGKNMVVPYEIELLCDYEKFGKLITEMDKSERLIRINEFSFNNSPDIVRKNKLEGKLPDANIKIEVAAITLNKIVKKKKDE